MLSSITSVVFYRNVEGYLLQSISVLLFLGMGAIFSSCQSPRSLSKQTLWSPAMPQAVARQAPVFDLHALEFMVHQESNRIRKTRNKESLIWSDTIAYVARLHSDDMAKNVYFAHTDLDGNSPSERATKAGLGGPHKSGKFVIEGFGENLFATHLYAEYTVTRNEGQAASYQVQWKTAEEIAREAVAAWMKSTAHRENLLSSAYRQQGIGLALGANGTLFVTQNLY